MLIALLLGISYNEHFDPSNINMVSNNNFSIFLLTAILAVGIPQLGHMISLVGSLGSVSLAITFPALINLAALHHEQKISKLLVIKNIFIIVFGVLGTLTGVFVSMVDIIWTFKHGGEHVAHHRHLANSTSSF